MAEKVLLQFLGRRGGVIRRGRLVHCDACGCRDRLGHPAELITAPDSVCLVRVVEMLKSRFPARRLISSATSRVAFRLRLGLSRRPGILTFRGAKGSTDTL